MNIATIILVYVVVWWMVFFAALPIGVRSQHESEEGITEGTEPGAPSNPNLLKKAFYTSLIAAVLTTGYYFLAESGAVNFRVPR
jgi:predicted secreted protein